MKRVTLIGWYIIVMAFIAVSLLSLAGCKTVRSVETDNESHKVSQLVDRMDSLFKSTASWQQDIYSKQTSLIDSIREREKSNTSQSVVLNEKGDTIKETIIIERIVERERSTDSKESDTIIHLQSQIDSLVRLTVENRALTDSLLKEHSKETVIEKKPTWWQNMKQQLGEVMLILLIAAGIVIAWKFKHR